VIFYRDVSSVATHKKGFSLKRRFMQIMFEAIKKFFSGCPKVFCSFCRAVFVNILCRGS
jgi:hypothetical protein